MRRLITAIILAIFFIPLPLAADQIVQVDRPNDLPSFLGYVQDEFIVVMKPEIAKMSISKAANNIVSIGDEEFDALAKRYDVTRFKKQFVGSTFGASSPSNELAKFHKIKFESGALDEAMDAFSQNPLVERVEPIGIHTEAESLFRR